MGLVVDYDQRFGMQNKQVGYRAILLLNVAHLLDEFNLGYDCGVT